MNTREHDVKVGREDFYVYNHVMDNLDILNRFIFFCFSVKKVCVPNPCRNGGKCLEDKSSAPCECAQGFTGKYCTGEKNLYAVAIAVVAFL